MSHTKKVIGVDGEALQLHAVYIKPCFNCKSRENSCKVSRWV